MVLLDGTVPDGEVPDGLPEGAAPDRMALSLREAVPGRLAGAGAAVVRRDAGVAAGGAVTDGPGPVVDDAGAVVAGAAGPGVQPAATSSRASANADRPARPERPGRVGMAER